MQKTEPDALARGHVPDQPQERQRRCGDRPLSQLVRGQSRALPHQGGPVKVKPALQAAPFICDVRRINPVHVRGSPGHTADSSPGMHEPYWYPLYEPGPNRLASLNDLCRPTITVGITIPPET